MKAYKGFASDMTCRGFRYEEGKSYKTDNAKCCETGFHACESPIDCFGYYAPGQSVYHEVELDGRIDRSDEDTKIAATKINIGARLNIPMLCKATFEYVRAKCTNEHNAEPGKAATAGSFGAATAGDRGAATSRGAVSVGKYGVGTVRATTPKIMGGMGAMLTIARERECNYDIVAWKSFVVDGETYKPYTWYTLDESGNVVEAKDGGDE